MGQKGHVIYKKRLKCKKKRQKIEFLCLEYLLSDGIFLSGNGGSPPLLTKKSAKYFLTGSLKFSLKNELDLG